MYLHFSEQVVLVLLRRDRWKFLLHTEHTPSEYGLVPAIPRRVPAHLVLHVVWLALYFSNLRLQTPHCDVLWTRFVPVLVCAASF